MQLLQGDSGSPVWQYNMGRAVVFAVESGGIKDERTGCDSDSFKLPSRAMWVDREMDWVKNVTQLS